MDWLCIGDGGEEIGFVVTTSHPDETLKEVEEFARQWKAKNNDKIEIIRL